MPIYRYRCAECGAQEEHLQKFSDPPVEICATCGGPLAKQMTAAAFHLKGGGWYKDLYASSKPGEAAAKPDAAKSDAGKSDAAAPSSGASSSDGAGGTPASSSTGSSTTASSSAA